MVKKKKRRGLLLIGSNQSACYYAVTDMGNVKIQQILSGRCVVAACISCHSIPYPGYPLHCKCGYQPHCMGPNLIYQSHKL